jgi:acyl-CoA hydrolase
MRIVSEETLLRHLQALPNQYPRLVCSGNHAVPWRLVAGADKAVERYRLFALNGPAGLPDRPEVTLETCFVGAGMRGRPTLAYYPSRLSLVPALLKRELVPDVVLLHVAPPRQGLLSLGVEVNVLPAAIEAAHAHGGLVVAQVNPRMPYTYGDALLPVDDVDFAIETDTPVGELHRADATEVQQVIGAHVASLVGDGATLQLGIGAIPDATLAALGDRRELQVWSEMISDGVMHLDRAGALAEKTLTTSFAAGSAEFYEWLDGNPRLTFTRTERTNDPAVIARQPAMTSINAALQVDLFAQANASYVRGRIYSGFGGQTDFVVGALHSAGGHAIIALSSWHEATSTSTIVDHLPCPATSFQHSYVVTEHGVATIWGRPQRQQAQELIDNAAHPQAREALRTQAAQLF